MDLKTYSPMVVWVGIDKKQFEKGHSWIKSMFEFMCVREKCKIWVLNNSIYKTQMQQMLKVSLSTKYQCFLINSIVQSLWLEFYFSCSNFILKLNALDFMLFMFRGGRSTLHIYSFWTNKPLEFNHNCCDTPIISILRTFL